MRALLEGEEKKMRGCEKKVVFLRHPDSRLFEEAYFVMKRDREKSPPPSDMVAEAERILWGEEPMPTAEKKEEKPKREGRIRKAVGLLIAFLLGAGAAVCALALL